MSFDDLDFDADLTAAQLEEIEEFASRIHVEETFRLVSLAPMVPSTVPRPTPTPTTTSGRIRKAEAAAAALIKKAETKAGELLRKADAAAAALIAKAKAAEAKPKKATKKAVKK